MNIVRFDVVIAGGGLTGLCLGYWLRRIMDVVVLEEHEVVGYPMHCTGLVGSTVIPLLPIKPQVAGRYDTIRICDLKGHCVIFRLKGDKAYMIERPLLEGGLAERLGNSVMTGVRALKFHRNVVYSDKAVFKCDAFVIAEGARLSLTKMYLPWTPRAVYGIQADVRLSRKGALDPNEILVIFDMAISKRFFAWVVPREDGLYRIGLADSTGVFERLRLLMAKFGVDDVKRVFGGTIITGGSPRHVANGQIALIGDAGGFIKYTTGGGIGLGALGAYTLFLCIDYALKRGFRIEDAFLAYDFVYRRFFLKRLIAYDLVSGLIHGPLRVTLQNVLVELSGLELETRDYDDHLTAILNTLLRYKGLFIKSLSETREFICKLDESWLKGLVEKAFYTITS